MISLRLNCGNIDDTVSSWEGVNLYLVPLGPVTSEVREDEEGWLVDCEVEEGEKK